MTENQHPVRTFSIEYFADIVHKLDSIDTMPMDANALRTLTTRTATEHLIKRLQSLLFPFEHPGDQGIESSNFGGRTELLGVTAWELAHQIHRILWHRCNGLETSCEIMQQAFITSLDFSQMLPPIRNRLLTDAQASYEGDPAARNTSEIISTYPGFYATMVYRLAHALHHLDVPLLPRLMTEIAHSQTGIDIHPGATIGESFFIDHGTGVVVGETTIIGKGVTLYQGVTLGALNFPHDQNGKIIRGRKRHPTIGDSVVIYAGATILGGDTIVGQNSVIGGNVWLTRSVPENSMVTNQPNFALRSRD